jgi:hypothetical protein
MAISIAGGASNIWPWLAQIGQDRGGFYSYDFLERLFGFKIRNAERVYENWQRIEVGDGIRLHPRTTPLTVGIVQRKRALVMMAGKALGAEILEDPTFMRLRSYDALTWGYYLTERGDGTTRFVARFRVRWQEKCSEIAFNRLFIGPIYFVMQRRICLGLRVRVERSLEKSGG